ncbi:hypothetical protein [Yinghuangia soli]|uniref:Uncharacterized protein n=1 Tax=Yinghuangia soli TaxID=2908204 RepID=A0AA41Q563_9ACTN|nr:hypothetical protein [Yinghuangia soli]MCF2530322.1 hypothetical protein [Yinghuangia soli]
MSEQWTAPGDGDQVEKVPTGGGGGAAGGPRRGGSGAGAMANGVIGALVLVLVAIGTFFWVRSTDDDEAGKSGFTAQEFFGDDGARSIQDGQYLQLAKDDAECAEGAEPGLAVLLDEVTCEGVLRAVSVDAAKKYVVSVAVVSFGNETDAQRIAGLIKSGNAEKAGGVRARFLVPPPASGAVYRPDPGNRATAVANGHYVLTVEIARFDGSPLDAADPAAATVGRDLMFVPTDHIVALKLRD